MITALRLTDFKAFHGLDIELRPLTVLIGENNSGKSSIIAALRLLAQTNAGFEQRVPLLLNGQFGDFGTYRDVVHGNHRGRPFHISIRVTDGEDPHPTDWTLNLEFKYRTVRRELILRELQLYSHGDEHVLTMTHSKDADRHLVTRIAGRPIPVAARARIASSLRLFHFLPLFIPVRPSSRPTESSRRIDAILASDWYEQAMSQVEEANYDIRSSLEGIDYLGSMRRPPERTYAQTGEVRGLIGAAGENWVNIWMRESSASPRTDDRATLVAKLRRWLKRAGLAAEVTPKWASDRHFEIELQHPVTGESENLADVGQANSQVLPVLVGGYRMRSGSTFLVEEPEIHLHPRAQAELGDFFFELYKSGVRSIVETHSEYLLLRIQQHVARGVIPSDDVALYYLRATRKGKRMTRLELDDEGRFVRPIPGGFFPERMEEAKRLARLRSASLIKKSATQS